jgi:hypothetical protein
MIESYVSGDWDTTLPQVRQIIDGNQNVDFLIFGYVIGATYIGDFEALLDFYDSYIGSPEWMVSRHNENMMPMFVPAMRVLNRDADAQVLLDAFHEYLLAEDARGVKNSNLDRQWSTYHALLGEHDAAIARLQAAFDAGNLTAFWQYSPEYFELERDPGFVAIKEANLAVVNAQRVDLGWAPVAEVGIFYEPNAD